MPANDDRPADGWLAGTVRRFGKKRNEYSSISVCPSHVLATGERQMKIGVSSKVIAVVPRRIIRGRCLNCFAKIEPEIPSRFAGVAIIKAARWSAAGPREIIFVLCQKCGLTAASKNEENEQKRVPGLRDEGAAAGGSPPAPMLRM